jgi:hypothetical protein
MVSAPRRDLAARYLDAIVGLLPAARSEWGRAMQAELATIDSPFERWRFALGCTRVALLPRVRSRAIRQPPAAAVAVSLVLGGEIALASAIGPFVPLILVLALLAWLGRRPGFFGPVRPDGAARVVRGAAYVLLASFLFTLALADGVAGRSDSGRGGVVVSLMLTLSAAVFLAITARSTRFASAGLAFGTAAGVVAGLAGFVVMPFERAGAPLADGLPGHGRWLVPVVFGAPAAAALLTGRRTRRTDQAVMAALCAGTFAALLVALLGLGAIALFPGRVPDIAGSMMAPGTSSAARHAEDVIEASDPYAGLLVFGALLAALLWAAARPPTRAETKVALLALLAVPPIALGLSARHSSAGAAAITFATATVVLAAVVTTTRPDAAA